jgi:hypothetical protein
VTGFKTGATNGIKFFAASELFGVPTHYSAPLNTSDI